MVFEAAIPEIAVCDSVPAAFPMIEIAFPFCDNVMFEPPARVMVPLEISAPAPAVLPSIVTSCRFCVWTVCATGAATEIRMVLAACVLTVTPPPAPVMTTVPVENSWSDAEIVAPPAAAVPAEMVMVPPFTSVA